MPEQLTPPQEAIQHSGASIALDHNNEMRMNPQYKLSPTERQQFLTDSKRLLRNVLSPEESFDFAMAGKTQTEESLVYRQEAAEIQEANRRNRPSGLKTDEVQEQINLASSNAHWKEVDAMAEGAKAINKRQAP